MFQVWKEWCKFQDNQNILLTDHQLRQEIYQNLFNVLTHLSPDYMRFITDFRNFITKFVLPYPWIEVASNRHTMHARIFSPFFLRKIFVSRKWRQTKWRQCKDIESEPKLLPKPTKRRNESTFSDMTVFLQNFSSSCVVKIDHWHLFGSQWGALFTHLQ
jgi:hypothetical protein